MSQSGTLLLKLEGPLQSWGYRSRFKNRDTGLEPSKSGVIGLLYCALGRDRSVPPTDLAKLNFHVRVERQGTVLTDFHTAGGGTFRGAGGYYAPTSSGAKGKNPIITERQYLVDAAFLVALHGESSLLGSVALALQDPSWPLSLGRKSCPPSSPVFVQLMDGPPYEALKNFPPSDRHDPRPRFVWEVATPDLDTEARNDVPREWPDRMVREYSGRFVKTEIGVWPS